jgi:hypothetical protein
MNILKASCLAGLSLATFLFIAAGGANQTSAQCHSPSLPQPRYPSACDAGRLASARLAPGNVAAPASDNARILRRPSRDPTPGTSDPPIFTGSKPRFDQRTAIPPLVWNLDIAVISLDRLGTGGLGSGNEPLSRPRPRALYIETTRVACRYSLAKPPSARLLSNAAGPGIHRGDFRGKTAQVARVLAFRVHKGAQMAVTARNICA